MQDRWTHFATTHGKLSAICAEFENLFHTTLNTPDGEEKILDFIRRKACADIDDFLAAAKLNDTLNFYCKNNELREFWRELDKNEFSTEPVPF